MEQAPKLTYIKAIELINDPNLQDTFKKIDEDYAYWDKVKYIVPKGYDCSLVWQAVKIRRTMNYKSVMFGNYKFNFYITEKMQSLLHVFDMNFGGSLGTLSPIPEKNHGYYLVNSIMEEAIASSQMEGASTTRRVAKDMLRKQSKPQNKSQQMILNNYSTIQYLSEHQSEDFSIEKLLEIHRSISQKTLEDENDEGKIRDDDNIFVMDGITGDVAHTPPTHTEIEGLLNDLCEFANKTDGYGFIHPIIKGIIIHFMLAYIHPFVDGNGRTARSLVYWYMLKQNYWLTEYLSISRVIYKSKNQYEKAFLYTEMDGLDLSYFIQYNLEAMKKSYEELKSYLQRKISEQDNYLRFHNIPGINQRQAQILRIIVEKPTQMFTVKELTTRFSITSKTARADLQGLVKMQFMKEFPLNLRTVAYMKSDDFDNMIELYN